MAVLRATIASLLLVAACDVGEVPGGSGAVTPDANTGSSAGSDAGSQQQPSGPEATFNSQIKPIVSRCAVVGCHAGAQEPNLSSYGTLAAKYKTHPGSASELVIHGTKTANVHSGMPWLSTGDQATISAWLDSLPST